MVYEDLELQMSSEELGLKCQLIRALFTVIDALVRRFGEVHLEQRHDEYAVLRVIFNEDCRMKGVDDSFTDQNPVFSSVVEFTNNNETVKANALTCHFLSARHTFSLSRLGKPMSKIFCFSQEKQTIERTNPETVSIVT